MILNVSGRTDIVAFYSKWFKNRYKEGYVDVRNPFYPKLISRIYFKNVDLIVFCTKNPHPIISFLSNIKEPILFHVTLTPYKKEIEPNVPNKKTIIEDIIKISKIIGKENIFVRYDPIFFSDHYTVQYHIKAFAKLTALLEGYVSHIIVSFLDNYKNVQKNRNVLRLRNPSPTDLKLIGTGFSKLASKHKMTVQTCSEYQNLEEYGFIVSDCVPKSLAYQKTGKKYGLWKGRNKEYCHCVNMVDIGWYNTCHNLCKYCYANFLEEKIEENRSLHDPKSSLLIGKISKEDVIKERVK